MRAYIELERRIREGDSKWETWFGR
jgi:hypothetical protein